MANNAEACTRRDFCRTAALTGGALLTSSAARADEKPVGLTLTSPVPRQVVQREEFRPAQAHDHEPGGPQLGQARVAVAGRWTGPVPVRLEARVSLHEGCTGRNVDWTPLGEVQTPAFAFDLVVPAGGWYRLEVRAMDAAGTVLRMAEVDPFGVGEVFVISGQSYAAGANDELQTIDDPLERSVLLDVPAQSWRTANDPFPHVGDGGTIWPAFANALQPIVRVPVGLVNVAVGGTATRQWLPGEDLYQRFVEGGRAAGRFRFVLWQQGESDVIENISTETYVERLQIIRDGLTQEWGFGPTWLLAKSTLHPTVYNKPIEEARIREAIDKLWKLPGFAPGPDTDILAGENRGGVNSRRHFSPIGQRRAGLMWFASVWAALLKETTR